MGRFQGSICNCDIAERNHGDPPKHSSVGPFGTGQISLGTEQPPNLAHVMGVFIMVTLSHAKKLNCFCSRGTCAEGFCMPKVQPNEIAL